MPHVQCPVPSRSMDLNLVEDNGLRGPLPSAKSPGAIGEITPWNHLRDRGGDLADRSLCRALDQAPLPQRAGSLPHERPQNLQVETRAIGLRKVTDSHRCGGQAVRPEHPGEEWGRSVLEESEEPVAVVVEPMGRR